MASNSSSILKLKAIATDDSSDDEKDTGNDLGLSFDKLNLGPRKKLLVLCLGGFLVHRVHYRNKSGIPRNRRPDFTNGNFQIYKRPFCEEFLKFCFERFDVGLWSSAVEHNIEGVLRNVMGELRSKLLFVWDQDECTDSGFKCLDKKEKPIFLKELKQLWEKKHIGDYSSSNTLLIENDPYKALLNPPNTAIFPDQYKAENKQDNFLDPKGQLGKYLDGLAEAKDVPSYVKEHPIGQPAITSSHKDWGYYSKIVLQFSKEGDGEKEEEDSS